MKTVHTLSFPLKYFFDINLIILSTIYWNAIFELKLKLVMKRLRL
jgi:hypothetical protein